MEFIKEKNARTKTLYVMCGIPGSGKSYAAKQITEKFTKYVSRDEVRFSMLKEGQDYFSQERKVFSAFIGQIQALLNDGYNVIADATHLNRGSRAKLLNALDLDGVKVIAFDMFDVPFEVCVERNAQRSGRERVPDDAMKNMKRYSSRPTQAEGFDTILKVEYKGDR